ncbi:transcriptional regulator PtsJ [Xenorhabdus sp. M]|uniref:Transcriptional regulator PtsJ n=1 Tax=Xenorhabdus szentirmaii TaxID=290112 RepID=A0AAW3YU44_9GAMM|nr:transcriptional regulator PtsJ [Xenorhabdus sp. M]MBD2800541.1 transcriptional regulator PtsJ [Xenorhabdus sp. M]
MITGKTATDIFEQIRTLVQSGNYKPGDSLPPVRELAIELSINRNTVAAAYKRLADAGIAVSKGRNGTLIREQVQNTPYEGTPPGLALRDMAGGNPSPALLPKLRISSLNEKNVSKLYGEPIINMELERIGRNLLEQDLQVSYELNLTNGAVDAVERLLTCYLISGDKIAVEDPCFLSSINTIKNNRFVAIGVPVDEEGIQVSDLSAHLAAGVQAIIITPRAHNPTGWGLSAARAVQLKELLECYPQVLVIVDDHFSLLSTTDYQHIIPATTRHWALIRSTSKFLGPDIRLAFVASDTETSQHLRQRLNSGTNWVSHILQEIVTATWNSPDFGQELTRAKETYWKLREHLTRCLKDYGINVSEHHDGLNLWLPLEDNSTNTVMLLAQHGWLTRGGEVFGVTQTCHGLRITISELDESTIESLAKVLAGILKVDDKHRQKIQSK